MNRSLRRTSGLAALALTVTLGLAACGDDSDSGDSGSESSTSQSPSESMSSESPSDDMSSSMSSDPAAQIFGPACSSLPSSGPGSLDTMASEPVATAASGNPLLKTLTAALGKADLVDTLNAADGITVFAPTDDAFAKVPKKQLNALLADKVALTKVLSYHVVSGEIAPDKLAGSHETIEGSELTAKGSGENFTVGTQNAKVLCGNIPTANGVVYVIDSVLLPPNMG